MQAESGFRDTAVSGSSGKHGQLRSRNSPKRVQEVSSPAQCKVNVNLRGSSLARHVLWTAHRHIRTIAMEAPPAIQTLGKDRSLPNKRGNRRCCNVSEAVEERKRKFSQTAESAGFRRSGVGPASA